MVNQAFENTLRGKRAAMSGTLPLSTRSSPCWDLSGPVCSEQPCTVWPARAAESPEEAGPAAGPDRGALGRAPGSGTGGASGADWLEHAHAFRLSVEKETYNLIKKEEDFRPNSSPCAEACTQRAHAGGRHDVLNRYGVTL